MYAVSARVVVAGLQLAALSLQGQRDPAAFIRSFTGSHRFVLEYLVEEVLHQQPTHVQRFLLRTAILDRQQQTDAMADQSRRALAYLHPDNLPVRTTATWTLGFAYQLQGNRTAAIQTYTEALAISQASGNSMIMLAAATCLGQVQESENQLALAAGILYLVITIAAIVAHVYVPSQLLVPGDATATAHNILAQGTLFRIGIGSEILVLFSEVVLSVLLYVLLKPVSKTLSLVAVVFRLVMTTIHAVNLLNSFVVLLLLSSTGYLAVFETDQINALVLLFLNAHKYGFTIGIVFFVPHVFILGYLLFTSGYLPKVLGVLFILAACGYLIDSTALLFVPGYGATPAFIALPIAIAEIAFPLWLLIKGINAEQWEKRAGASA
jgi:hypothetical protein